MYVNSPAYSNSNKLKPTIYNISLIRIMEFAISPSTYFTLSDSNMVSYIPFEEIILNSTKRSFDNFCLHKNEYKNYYNDLKNKINNFLYDRVGFISIDQLIIMTPEEIDNHPNIGLYLYMFANDLGEVIELTEECIIKDTPDVEFGKVYSYFVYKNSVDNETDYATGKIKIELLKKKINEFISQFNVHS